MAGSTPAAVRYYAYQVTNAAGFYLPISLLFLQDRGFGLFFVGLSGAVFNFAFLTVEIPGGYIGDRFGRKASLLVSSGLRGAAMASYPFAESAATFVVLWILWASGQTFRSGSLSAWLYEHLDEHGAASTYARVEGRGRTARLLFSAGAALAGGYLYTVDIRLPFLVNAALALAGIPLLLSFPTVEQDRVDDHFSLSEAAESLRVQAERPDIRWFVVFLALFWGIFQVSRNFTQPAVEAVGIPVTGLGVLYAAFQLLSAGAASVSGWLEEWVGIRTFFRLLPAVFAVSYASIAAVPLAVLPALFLYRGSMNVIVPFRNKYLNDRIQDDGRATVLSGTQMVLTFGASVASLVGGVVADMTGPVAVVSLVGVAISLLAGIVWGRTSPVRPVSTIHEPTDDTPAVTD